MSQDLNTYEYTMNMQEALCKKYDIILTDYKTKQQRQVEKINGVMDGVFNGIDKMCRGIDKVFNGLDKGLKVIDAIVINLERETTPTKKRKGRKSKKLELDGFF